MNALTLSALIAFWTAYPDAERPLRNWYKLIRNRDYASFAEVKADCQSADWVRGFIVFDIGSNKYCLIIDPDFEFKRFYIQAVLTHRQYDNWRP